MFGSSDDDGCESSVSVLTPINGASAKIVQPMSTSTKKAVLSLDMKAKTPRRGLTGKGKVRVSSLTNVNVGLTPMPSVSPYTLESAPSSNVASEGAAGGVGSRSATGGGSTGANSAG